MKRLFQIDEYIAGIFLVLTVVIVTLNIGMRYFFNAPIRSAEEIATICFIWSVFIGGASCYRQKMHMGIDILTQLLKGKIKLYIELLINIIVMAMNGVFAYLSVIFSYSSRLKPTAVLGISSIYVNFSLAVGFSLIFLYSIIEIIKTIKTIKNSKKEGEK